MKYLFKFLLVVLVLQVGFVYSQNTNNQQVKGKVVKWEALSGEDKEFIVYLPQSYEMLTDGQYYTSDPDGSSLGKVDKKLVIYRQINNVVLLMEFLQGDSKQVMKNLLKREKSYTGDTEEKNGFDFAQVVSDEDGYQKKKQYFRIKNRLYIIKAFFKSDDSSIADSFFKSVKLVNDGKAVSPNVPSDVKSISLPGIIEREQEKLGDDQAIESKEADQRAIVIHSPSPKFRNGNLLANKGKIKLRILYSASGKVSNVEVLESSSKSLEKPAVEAAKKTIFIPAVKNGKLVSEYAIQEYGIGVSSSFFIL